MHGTPPRSVWMGWWTWHACPGVLYSTTYVYNIYLNLSMWVRQYGPEHGTIWSNGSPEGCLKSCLTCLLVVICVRGFYLATALRGCLQVAIEARFVTCRHLNGSFWSSGHTIRAQLASNHQAPVLLKVRMYLREQCFAAFPHVCFVCQTGR